MGRRCGAIGLAGALSALCLPVAPALAHSDAADGALSPRLAELAKPSVRSASPGKQAAILDVAPQGQPGSLQRDGNRVLVDVRFDRGAASAVSDLRAAGAEVVHVSRRYQTVTLAVLPADLRAVAGVSRVAGISEDLAPILSTVSCSGAITSEGDAQLGAPAARSTYGVDGSGVTVGILSDSFNMASGVDTSWNGDVATGDLPGPGGPCGTTKVNLIDDSYVPGSGEPAATDEGRAMAQIVHDLAPGASIDFATAFTSETGFADNVQALANAGAKVIVDDVSYLDEPFFQDGPIAAAVNNVTAAGADYFSAAGNDNLVDGSGNDIASWEAPKYRSSNSVPSCPGALPSFATDCMNFNPTGTADNTFGIVVPNGRILTVDLQWAQPWYGVSSDMDAYLLDSNGKLLTGTGGQDDNVSGGEPVEILSWSNSSGFAKTVQLAINRCSGALCNQAASATDAPRIKFALIENGGGGFSTEYPTSANGDTVGPTVFGHAGASSAIAVGAVPAGAVPNTPSWTPESYSSQGPVTHYFDPAAGVTPAAALASPEVISKPDIAASDCVHTTFFYGSSHLFCGTSAAAPHAAAVAALMLQRDPLATLADIRDAMASTADPMPGYGVDAVGAGFLDAAGAVGALPDNSSSGGGSGSGGTGGSGGSGGGSTQTPPHSGSPSAQPTKATAPPNARFAKRPGWVVRTHKRRVRLTFRFASSQSPVTFLCEIDEGPRHACGPELIHAFGPGAHTVTVSARNSAGAVDPTPAVHRFRVERIG